MNYTKPVAIESQAVPRKRRSILLHLLLGCLSLLAAAGLFAAYEHYKLHDQSTASWLCLIAAALLALAPIRACCANSSLSKARCCICSTASADWH